MIIIKKLYILIVVLVLLVGCSDSGVNANEEYNANETSNNVQVDIEVLFDRKHDVVLIENVDLVVKLLNSKQERTEIMDLVSLDIEIKNKQNKSFEYSFRKIKLDNHSYDSMNIGMGTFEVKPNETITIDVSVQDREQTEFQEFIGGEFSYNDYSSNIPIAVESFSEYINE